MQTDNPMQARLCGAKTRGGGTCKNHAMQNGRCRMHGGKTPKGVNLPHFKHGRYSTYLPNGLKAAYLEAVKDAEFTQQRDSIALIDAMINTILPGVLAENKTPDIETIEQIRQLLDTRRKHVESIEKIQLMGERAVSIEKVMVLMSHILATIQKVVTDKVQQQAIAGRLTELINRPIEDIQPPAPPQIKVVSVNYRDAIAPLAPLDYNETENR